MGFREAIRRQSAVDRKAFNDGIKQIEDKRAILTAGSQFPHCWAMGSKHDVIWVREIIREDSPSEKAHHNGHNGNDALECPDEHGHTEEDHPEFVHLNSKRHKTLFGKHDATPKGRPSVDKLAEQLDTQGAMKETKGEWMVPIIFGRPDFASEIRGIGLARPQENVHVYICGNDMIVKSLQEVVKSCNHLSEVDAREKGLSKRQKYHVHFERFG